MTIHWGSLLAVFVVALGSTVAVVVLVTLGLVGLSARATRTGAPTAAARRTLHTPVTGTAVAAACFAAAAAIVVVGLWEIVAK